MPENKSNLLKSYSKWVESTAFYPTAGEKSLQEIMYLSLALTGEGGELANHVKKLCRDGDTTERRELVKKELGDILWYVARLADVLDTDLESLLLENQQKIEKRKKDETLTGDGDNR